MIEDSVLAWNDRRVMSRLDAAHGTVLDIEAASRRVHFNGISGHPPHSTAYLSPTNPAYNRPSQDDGAEP